MAIHLPDLHPTRSLLHVLVRDSRLNKFKAIVEPNIFETQQGPVDPGPTQMSSVICVRVIDSRYHEAF